MVVQVKLKSLPPKAPTKPKFDYSSVSRESKQSFNQSFRAAYGHQTTPPLTRSADYAWEIWTDGSGSRGKCSASTPAGWGYVVVEEGEAISQASGPVTTSTSSQFYLGATVGSNNTGELTAWMEAALYLLSLDQPPHRVCFHYDSKWAANMVT